MPPIRIGFGILRGLSPAPVEPQYVFGADTSANPTRKPKAGNVTDGAGFCFADFVRFFSAGEIFVS